MTDLPTYPYGTAPDHLKTKTQLNAEGLKPGPQVAWLTWGRGSRARSAALYNTADAQPKKPLSDAQRAALDAAQVARRTCTVCGKDQGYVLEYKICPACKEKSHQAHVAGSLRTLLNRDPLILDTETTDLPGLPCEIAIVDTHGTVLLNTLVNPQCSISPEAHAVHGISDADVAGAPTFAEIEPQLQAILTGRPVIAYNSSFDEEVLRRAANHARDAYPLAQNWIYHLNWYCLMTAYAAWYGDWDPRRRDYRWQRLPSAGHRALDDCQAALDLIRMMLKEPA